MKFAKQILIASTICLMMSTASFGQSTSKNGVAPVYIPGVKIGAGRISKSALNVTPISAKSSSSTSSLGTIGSGIGTTPKTSNATLGGSENAAPCENGCGADCGCDQVGQSFFGRLRQRSPFKVNFNSSGDSCNVDCDGNCGGTCAQNRLSRFLPITVKFRSNHCSRYISLFGGYVDLEDYDGQAGGATRLIEFNDGWQLGGTFGRRYGNDLRLESELTFRHNTADVYSTGSFVGPDFVAMSTFDAIDSVFSVSTMTNLLYDFNNLGSRTVPYIGFGVGGVYVDGDVVTPALGRTDSIDDYAFAYQLIAGLTRKINSRTEAYAEFRHLGSSGVEVETTPAGGASPNDFAYQNNNIVFGFRFTIPN